MRVKSALPFPSSVPDGFFHQLAKHFFLIFITDIVHFF